MTLRPPSSQVTSWDIYRRLRDKQPVYRDPGGGFYALSRFDDVWRAVNDWSRVLQRGGRSPRACFPR